MAGLMLNKELVQENIRTTQGASETADLEGRKHPKFFLSLPIEISQKETGKQLSHTMEVGETGLTLYIAKKLEVGQNLQLKLFFSYNSNSHVLDISSQIIWIKNQGDGNNAEGCYIAGVKFVNGSPKEMEVLRSFLNYLKMEVRVGNLPPQP